MAARNGMHRTIGTNPSRSRQLALAAAHLGLPDSEAAIQSFITAGLLSLAEHDNTFGLALARMAGVDWSELGRIAKEGSQIHENLPNRSARTQAR
jgi:hypothetical protein